MNNTENLSNLRKKIINTIDMLQEILDIADEVDTDKMADYNRPDYVDDLLSDSIKSDSINKDLPKKPCMKHWASNLPESVWEKFREDAIAVGDLH